MYPDSTVHWLGSLIRKGGVLVGSLTAAAVQFVQHVAQTIASLARESVIERDERASEGLL